MIHLAYTSRKDKELSKLLSLEKTMVVRGASGRKIPHSRVYPGEEIYFIEQGSKEIKCKGIVEAVYNFTKLNEEEINQCFTEFQPKLKLTESERNRWHKKCLCFVEVSHLSLIPPLAFQHQTNMDDWLILNQIEDVIIGSDIPYRYDDIKLK